MTTEKIARLLPAPGPTRMLALATLVNTIGNGLFFTAGAIFFTRSVGLSVAEVGLGLTIAGALGLGVGIPAGHLADRRGPREVLIFCVLVEALGMAAYVFVHSFPAFLLVASVATVAERASHAVFGALIAGLLTGEGRVLARAYLRSVTNVGISIGSVLAGLALASDSRAAYVAVVLGNAVSYLGTAVLLLRLPRVPPAPVPAEGPTMRALRDRPYLAVTAVNAVLTLHFLVLEIAMPLWVVQRTEAPRWVVAVLFLINTSAVVALQVRLSRGSDDLGVAARLSRRSGALLLVSCALFAAATGRSQAVAVGLLLAAALVHVFGEMWQSAGAWGLGFGLAPDHLQGQYQGVFATGSAVASTIGPALLTTVLIGGGVAGWLSMGLVFLVAGVAMVPLAQWAQRARSSELSPETA